MIKCICSLVCLLLFCQSAPLPKTDYGPAVQKILALVQKYGLKDTLLYSGKGPNDLGNYDSCLRDDMKYYIAKVA